MKSYILTFVYIMLAVMGSSACWGGHSKVKLKDVQTLTLYAGEMTTGRRSSPVPQLRCVGGSAGCSSFVPQVVQCYNKGFDGHDVQWECKTDMDNLYRFGRVEVECEGYDYPDDPYILKGSCGLKYSLELTKEGYQKQTSGGHNYYPNDHGHRETFVDKKSISGGSGGIFIVVICVVIFVIYKSCLSNSRSGSNGDDYSSSDQGPYPQRPSWFGGGGGGGGPYPSAPPPPYGFRDDYTSGTSGCGASSSSGTAGSSSGVGGFWSGATLGGILGYWAGNRNNQQTYHQPHRSSYTTHESFGGTGSTTYRASNSSSSSSGTRTASGFGGTSRR